MSSEPIGSVDLLWIPMGAGTPVARRCGRWFEALCAARDRRPRCELYHSALVVTTGDQPFAIEMTPVPDGGGAARGVVAEGPVGTRWAGRLRLFRYEVRCWPGGPIPDIEFAVAGPVRLSTDPELARRILRVVPEVPTAVWGRDELQTGEMWNSNSITSWILARAGIDLTPVHPPAGGRAPGWDAGRVVAARPPAATPDQPSKPPARRARATRTARVAW